MRSHLSGALHSQPPSFPAIQASMEISSPSFMQLCIPRSVTQTFSEYNSNSSIQEASTPYPEAFMDNSAAISRQRCGAGFIETSAFTSMETLMPNTIKPLSHQEPLEEFPCRRGFTQASTALYTGDFSANSANPCTYPGALMKMKELSACRNGLSIRRIENCSNRQVTFCKRRNGLFKKAYELSILCDAEVGAIIFSPSGKLSEFASSSMNHIIKRYQSFQPQMSSNDLLLQDVERWKREAVLLTSRLKSLQDFQRCVFEKNNMSFSTSEVHSIESMLEHALDKIRKRKMELIEIRSREIVKKGEILLNENNMLKEKFVQIISMKEYNASSGCIDLRSHQDVNTELQLGFDMLHHTIDEEKSYSSKN